MLGSWLSALAIITRRFMPPDSVWILESLLSHSDSSRRTFSICAGFFGLPNRPRLNDTVAHTVSNASVVSSCGTSPISERAARNSLTMSWPAAVTVPEPGLTMPQMMLISVVLPAPLGPSSAKISPSPDLEVDVLQRLEAGFVDLRQVRDGDDRLHGNNDAEMAARGKTNWPARKEDPVYMSPTCLFKPLSPGALLRPDAS